MGDGIEFRCKGCGHRYSVLLGVGMLYPEVYHETLGRIRDGAYGEELAELAREVPDVAIDASKRVFVCRACNTWVSDVDATLYEPLDRSNPHAGSLGPSDGTRQGSRRDAPCVMAWDLKERYRVLRPYHRTCERCGRPMEKAAGDELWHLPCPRCGTPNEVSGIMKWD